jgi:hypothetical protein
MNLTDTFYVALCMTILILGVVYWFWTQNQYIQRKLNLLENIVFEIKTQIHKDDSPPLLGRDDKNDDIHIGGGERKYAPAPSSELGEDEDLLNEELEFETENDNGGPSLKITEDIQAVPVPEPMPDDHEDDAALQPGGVGSGVQEVPEADKQAKGNVLEGMTIKELQRLAEQKGISTARLRKPQLIEAIRNSTRSTPPVAPTIFETKEATLELS